MRDGGFIAREHDGIRFDGRVAPVLGETLPGRERVYLGLYVAALKVMCWRLAGVNAMRMFVQIPAVSSNEPARAWMFSQQFHHAGDAVHDVVVQRTATECEPSCYCEIPRL